MDKIKIPESEFSGRISKLKIEMKKEGADAVAVYGDEYLDVIFLTTGRYLKRARHRQPDT